MNSRNRKSESEEVEELLRAAEDDVSLKLSLNSHMARGSSTQFIDPDLDQRFQALRSKQTPPKKPISQKGLVNQPPSATSPTDESDDLLTRFASLKSSLPSYSSASSSAKQHAVVEDDDDEVEKVIKWAIDAARLDPSPPSGTDDDDENTTDEEDEGENSDDDFNRGHRKAKRK
ncbi:uncharacterized protein LOC125877110 [Solanum stenotomum]|uniref:uncharacterized protein LOC125877110 n=1 Tax=Solanum stenotomum TaxID=172797 RepID=UPI0020D0879E|nr:uncharacterized protein LOC125877110 [Solanum stenotomum]